MIVGIDYGSKLAGTTVIAWKADDLVHVRQSTKKKSADHFLSQHLIKINPTLVAIDAPLSLPSAYFGEGDDFFYRKCDRDLKAMSPMFLGGLTARAMKLRKSFFTQSQKWIEVYPKATLQQLWGDVDWYKKDLTVASIEIQEQGRIQFAQPLTNWHQFDAALAWISGDRYKAGQAQIIGKHGEGYIYI